MLSLLMALAAAACSSGGTSEDSAEQRYTFKGAVSSDGNDLATHAFTLPAQGTIAATLDWTRTSADLTLVLRDPSGDVVAETATTSRPESLSFRATDPGTYRIAVRAREGSSNYTATVVVNGKIAPVATSGSAIRSWSPIFMGPYHRFTEQEAVEQAKRFDVIVAHPHTFEQFVRAMKAANPDLALLGYYNAAFATKQEAKAFPDSWYARDANGKRVRSVVWGNYLMDISNPLWIENRQQVCESLVSRKGYDGCVLDMMGTAPLDPGYATSLPVNPATGEVWTDEEWYEATSRISAAVKEAAGSRPVMPNGLRSGRYYFDPAAPSSQLLEGTDGGIPEAFCRLASDDIDEYRTEEEWKQDVDMLVDAGSKGKKILAITKAWVDGSAEQKDAWHEYCLASFLLGTNGESLFYFTYDREIPAIEAHPWWNLDLGAPKGQYSKVDGVYQREFASGRVLVNPTGGSFTVSLDGSYVDLEGDTVESVELGPYSASILTTG